MNTSSSSEELSPRDVVRIVFEFYAPSAIPRSAATGVVGGKSWTLMVKATGGAPSFYFTPADSADPKDRVTLPVQILGAAFAAAPPAFSAFATASGDPRLAGAQDSPGWQDDEMLWDSMRTDLGDVSLFLLRDRFELRVAHRRRTEEGGLQRSRVQARALIKGEVLATGAAQGVALLRAACDASPDTLRGLFPDDQRMDAEALRAVLQASLPQAPAKTKRPGV